MATPTAVAVDTDDTADTADTTVGAVDTVDRGTPGNRVIRLAELRTAGLVRQASEPAGGVERSLPVSAALRPLLPGGALRRGGTVAVDPGVKPGGRPGGKPGERQDERPGGRPGGAGLPGSTSLLFALIAEATAAGSWCAAVGLPGIGLVAAAEAGVAVERFALVPHPGPDWAAVVAALVDGVDIVVVATPGSVAAPVANRLTARARQRGAVLVPVGRWPGADLTLEVTGSAWHGLGRGRGRLRTRELEVYVHGRGAAARGRRATLWFPGSGGAAAPGATPTPTPLVIPEPVVPQLGLAG